MLHSPVALTEHFEEELPLLGARLVGGPAGVAAAVTLADVADGEHAAAAVQPAEDVLLRRLQPLPFPAPTQNQTVSPRGRRPHTG